ncbi:glycosyltransferase involved in cell wall biosynthesis [Oceanotoga teriensis]|uniref:Glycosyltransferase involved in cell wall biosynthesis n=1 Tax=Oceanotoga teriensis TaxID=515440 RepID=A0AA45C558_9BACT|nr:glycosyltransferase family 4 protein [Oceanotoga teriensis]PWJ88091.1 glycosyltransferase involved in cell wall biosynthesis [Oceanotoga teriensis]
MDNDLMVIDLFNTDYGAYRLLRTRVEKVDKRKGFKNYLICPDGIWSDKMKKMGIKVINVNLSNSMKLSDIKYEIKELVKVFKEYKPDIVHTHASKPGATGRIAAKKADVPLIIHQVHGFHFTQYKGIKRKIYEFVEKYLSKYCDILLFQNMDEYNYCKDNGYEKNSVLRYIGNGIPFEEFKDYIKKDKKFNFDKKRIACTARWEGVKNHAMLFDSIKILKEKYSFTNFELNLYGEGVLELDLKKKANSMDINDVINFIGTLDREDIISEIYDSDLSVLTSFKEGKPRALMESSALGVPIVATDVIGTNEVVKNNRNGYLVKLGDSENFAKRIYELLNDSNKWKEFSDNAKLIAKDEFDENKTIENIISVYLNG